MKRTITIATLLFALCSTSFAVIWFSLLVPQDAPEARKGIENRPVLKPFTDEYWAIIKARLWPLKLNDVAKAFGPKLATATNWWGYYGGLSGPELGQHPADLVLPIFATRGMMVSGLHTGDPLRDKSHTDLHGVGDIGYVEFYYQLDGESIQNAAIYFRTDDKFVPLKSTNDFSKRLDWDKSKFNALTNWLDAHLTPMTDTKKASPDATTTHSN
jgi:hypothetical protein